MLNESTQVISPPNAKEIGSGPPPKCSRAFEKAISLSYVSPSPSLYNYNTKLSNQPFPTN